MMGQSRIRNATRPTRADVITLHLPHSDTTERTVAERVSLGLPMVGNTAPYNASGHPAISLPCGEHDGLPVGLMLIGRHFGEADLLSAAEHFEKNA